MTDSLSLVCFDYGKKRIGVAVGQTLTRTASPLITVHVHRGAPDWDAISRIGTIVFLMGVEHLPEIVEKLIAHGRGADTPVALIQEGATLNQRVVTATLADIVEKTRDIRPPAVVVVGEVVSLQEQLAWFTPQAIAIKSFQDAFVSS